MEGPEHDLPAHWRRAATTPEIVTALEGVYARTAASIAERGPACWASGRCCNFKKTGHLLYVTGLEAAYCVTRLTTPLTMSAVGRAREAGGCPFQAGNLCGVHPIRPLGCRVYFCDRSAQDWQQALYEEELRRVRQIHDQFGVEYRYGEWRRMLEELSGPE